MSLPRFGVRRPVAANLVMFAIVGAGVIFGSGLRREFFPETRPNEVLVTAPYPGASPDEVEDSLAIKIEDKVADLRDVKEINTTVVEGAATVRIEFEPGVDIDDAVARVKRAVDELQDLPERSERIVVTEFEPNIPVINLTIFGEASERTLKTIAQEVRDDLRTLPGMGDVFLTGVRGDEISVEVREEALLEHGVSLVEVARRVTEAMSDIPGGAVRQPTSIVSLRTEGAEEASHPIRGIPVAASPGGRVVTLGEVARVSEGFVDADVRTRFDGARSMGVVCYATGDQDVIQIADMVKAYVAGRKREAMDLSLREQGAVGEERSALPARLLAYRLGASREALPGVDMRTHNDLARFVRQRLELLSRNALWGGVLVFLTLLVLLAPRVALWVTVGLIVSLMGTLAVMRLADISLNFLTMFGLIIVLGLLVDDAIVVAENISAKHEAGLPPLEAAVSGAGQVSWPVVATVLTTICAFMPLRLIEGRIGDLMGALPVVVACALGVSLLESLLILPAHMAHSLKSADRRAQRRRRRRGASADRAERARRAPWRERVFHDTLLPRYGRALEWCLERRYLTVAAATGLVFVSVGMVVGGRVPFTFLVSADAELVTAEVRMPVGTPLNRTDEVVSRIEAVARAMPETDSVLAIVGAVQDVESTAGAQQTHLGQLFIELKPVEERERRSDQVIDAMRAELGEIPGVKRLRFEEVQGGPAGPAITLTAVGRRPEAIAAVVEEIKHELARFEGVYGIADDADAGQRELRIRLREGAAELGFTTAGLAQQIRGAVFGIEAHTFAGDREDVDVRVMLDTRTRRSLAALEGMFVFTPSGRSVPLAEVAEITEGEGYATLRRLNRERAVTVTADVNRSVANPEEITAELLPIVRRLADETPGVRVLARGRQEDLADSFRSLPIGMLAAVGMIYVILAWLFSSYTQPLIVLTAIPFALIGVVWSHLALGFDMTILSLIGFVALTGIVVNDSLILMEFFNHKREEGMPLRQALVASGQARFRAILLTTMTTFLGLSPLMAEQSFQARFLIPMAITISFGLLSATVVILLVLPCLMLIGADIRRGAQWVWHAGRPPAAAEAAR